MIEYKTHADVSAMQRGGRILSGSLKELQRHIRPGIKTIELERIAQRLILAAGGEPGFQKVSGYKYGTCICINEQVVHTPPSERVIQKGDVVTVDCGVFYNRFHTDAAITVQVEPRTNIITRFLSVGRQTLYKAIAKACAGNRIGDISEIIESGIRNGGYCVIVELTGHGIGTQLHQKPSIPGVSLQKKEQTDALVEGMTLAIEVIYSMGSPHIRSEKGNKWSLVTKDKSISACFEHTIAILKNKTFILT